MAARAKGVPRGALWTRGHSFVNDNFKILLYFHLVIATVYQSFFAAFCLFLQFAETDYVFVYFIYYGAMGKSTD